MNGRLLLYGASGFSGGLLAATLADLGPQLVLAGRSADTVAPLATRLGVACRVFALTDAAAIDAALGDIAVVLHCAGPFVETAPPMIAACLRTRTDYLDISGEWPVFTDALARDAEAASAGVMLLPGVGFSITASDCLLALATAPDTVRLRLAVSRPGRMARGSVMTMLQLNDAEVRVRRVGKVERLPAGRLSRRFDFGDGERHTVAVTWPDVVTAQHSTGVTHIETYAQSGWAGQIAVRAGALAAPVMQHPSAAPWLRAAAAFWPEAPADDATGFVLVAEAEDRWRRTTTLRLHTRDGHTVTTATAGAVVRRVLAGQRVDGFTTPAKLFGADFILGLGCAELETPARQIQAGHAP